MKSKVIQIAGLALTITYAAFIIWIYATEPRTFKEVANSAEVAAGTYQINQEKFDPATLCSFGNSFGPRAMNGNVRIRPRAMHEPSFTSLTRFTGKAGVVFTTTRICSSKDWKPPTAQLILHQPLR